MIILAVVADAPAEMISSYDYWRWGGFTSLDSGASGSSSSTVLVSSNGTSGANSYSSWQWGGFSRSTSNASTTNAVFTSPQSSSTASITSLLISTSAAESAENGVTTSLSGYVYYDENGNGCMETDDWGVVDAAVALTTTGSSDPILTTYTDAIGKYTFKDLSPGTYSITLLTPSADPPDVVLGQLYDSEGNQVADAGRIADGGFYDIEVADGYRGINYIFCMSEYPVSAVSKRLLIDGGPGHALPEPAALVLVAAAGLVIGLYSRHRS